MFKLGRNDLCWCQSGRKYKKCHSSFDSRLEEYARRGAVIPSHRIIKNAEQIEGIRESCKVNIAVLDYISERIKEGISTEEIDRWVYEQTTRLHGIPAPLNYEGFPKSVCTSVNDQVCHGIPSPDVILQEGDIINVDVSTIYPYVKCFDTRVENGKLFKCYLVYKQTHLMDSKEMARLIDGAIEVAKELGIETDTPEQLARYKEEWRRG